jgi:hypothetical protein
LDLQSSYWWQILYQIMLFPQRAFSVAFPTKRGGMYLFRLLIVVSF